MQTTILKQAKYELIAAGIERMIDAGTLRAGERLASIRDVSRQHDVSVTTAIRAYRALEDKGIIAPRPQSGYFVTARAVPEEPRVTRPARAPQQVAVNSLFESVVSVMRAPDILHLGGAVPSPQLMPAVTLSRMLARVARRNRHMLTRYTFSLGLHDLRHAIARRAIAWRDPPSADDVVVTAGCTEALNVCLRAVAKPGDTIALESPTYFGVLQVIESLGMKALELPTDPRRGMSLDALEHAITRRKVKACIVMPNVHNPLGFVMRESDKRDLAGIASRYDVPVIEDDVYGELAFGAARSPCLKAYDTSGNVILCSSFSKTLSPGSRVGWIVPGKYRREIELLRFVSSIAGNEVVQAAIAQYLDGARYERHLRALRRAFEKQVQAARATIGAAFPPGTRVTNPRGGFLLWVELPQHVDATRLHRLALEQRIGIAPGPLFSAAGRYANFVRINCGLEWNERITNAIAALGELAADPATHR